MKSSGPRDGPFQPSAYFAAAGRGRLSPRAHVPGLARDRRHRRDRLEAVAGAVPRRRLLEVVARGDPVEAGAVRPAPQPAELVDARLLLDRVKAEGHAHWARLFIGSLTSAR